MPIGLIQSPSRASRPGYWMNETSGKLRPVIETYLSGEILIPREVAIMKAYLVQWIAGDYRGVEDLRRSVRKIASTRDIQIWLDEACELGIDPL